MTFIAVTIATGSDGRDGVRSPYVGGTVTGMSVLNAAICKQGHVVDEYVIDVEERVAGNPDQWTGGVRDLRRVPNFCKTCGAPVIVACESCAYPFPGFDGVIVVGGVLPAPFCENCGEPQPWASRKDRIGKLYNLIDFDDEMDDAARLRVTEAIAVLSEPMDDDDGEREARAGETIKKLAPKVWQVAQPVLSALLTAGAKKKLELP